MQNTTDTQLKALYKSLLSKSFAPYLNMIKLWICNGYLDDNYEEFMVLTTKQFTQENLGEYYYELFWEKKFVLSQKNV